MEISEGKSQPSLKNKPLSESVKLESKGIPGNTSFRHKFVEKDAPRRKSFEDLNELRSGKSPDANDTNTVQKESTPAKEVPAKLTLTHPSLNSVGIENIRNRFMQYN